MKPVHASNATSSLPPALDGLRQLAAAVLRCTWADGK